MHIFFPGLPANIMDYAQVISPGYIPAGMVHEPGTNIPAQVVALHYQTAVTAPVEAAFESAKSFINSVITEELNQVFITGIGNTTKIHIYVTIEPIDGPGNILGQAGPTSLRSSTLLPAEGIMEFDSADMEYMETQGILEEVILHEMLHVVGIGTLWEYKNLSELEGTVNTRYIAPLAVAEYTNLAGSAQTSIPLENSMGAGSNDSHWREVTFDHELMTPVIDSGFNPLSRMTIASLEDLGYSVDYDLAEFYSLPGSLRKSVRETSITWHCHGANFDPSDLPVLPVV